MKTIKKLFCLGLLFGVAANATESSKGSLAISGFIEFKYRNISAKDTAGDDVTSDTAGSGYMIDDGALYFNSTLDMVDITVDIPFGRDITTSSTGSSDTSGISLGGTKTQAFGTVKHSEALSFSFGQFDTIYGFELNDAKNRFFSEAGIVFNGALPVVHTGLVADYNMAGFGVKILSANPNNKGTLGTKGQPVSDNTEPSHEHGLMLGWSNDTYRFNLGYLARASRNVTTSESENRTLAEVLLGATFGSVNLDIEYDIVHDPTSTKKNDGTGIMVHLTYDINDEHTAGLRHETTSETLTSNFEETQTSIGYKHKKSDNFHYGLEYHMHKAKVTKNTDTSDTNTLALTASLMF